MRLLAVPIVIFTTLVASSVQAQPLGPWPEEPAPAPPPPAPIAAPACDGTIDVDVVDIGTHEPVAGALVSVDGAIVDVTDDQGHYRVIDLCHGDHTVEVEREDYEIGHRVFAVDGAEAYEFALHAVLGETIIVEEEAPEPTPLGSEAEVSKEKLEHKRGKSLTEAIADVPGVAKLGGGSGMAKPIVRGQFGRRLLMIVDGVRHRSQDWGLDHAPEIDPFVADRLKVVRGAAGVRYGPDAIGGAVIIEPPSLRKEPGVAGEVHLVGFGNGLGGSLAARVQAATAKLPGFAWQVQGSTRHLAAPSTPDYPLDNTGVDEWSVGATAGYHHGAAEYQASYTHYQALLGVCTCLRIDTIDDFYAQLERHEPANADLYESEFRVERPYQDVAHELAIARGKWRDDALGTLTATYAFQFDHRAEYDVVRTATTGPQFDFFLTTHDLDAVFEHKPIHLSNHLHLRGSAGVLGMVQLHEYGGLQLVPNHQAWGTGVHASERLVGHDFEVEAGVRYDHLSRSADIAHIDFRQLVRSGQIAEDACMNPDADFATCSSGFDTISASLGAVKQLSQPWAIKGELSTASRPPNPDEQYLNGTAPTFPVLGLGKPDLGPETTYSSSVTTTYQSDRVAAEASAYANYIHDYIYFAPALDETDQPIFDVLIRGTFPRFVTRPVNAVFAGADGGIDVKPAPWLDLEAQLSLVRAGNVTDHSYLVFVPSDRARIAATYTTHAGRFAPLFASVAGTYVARQSRYDLNADLAPPPPGYFLLDAELGAETRVGGEAMKVALSGTNLLNARYRDYTSLLRYFADQPGFQVLLRLSVQFDTTDPH